MLAQYSLPLVNRWIFSPPAGNWQFCDIYFYIHTMVQKLSKCEVKASLLKFDNFTATQILREIKF